jgi:acyl-CoA synthetase (AMP-forming)/AMP-acid ligase II
MLLSDSLAHFARVTPEREALVVGDTRLTWRDLNAGVNRFANALQKLGARHGDRVLLLLPNGVEFVEAYYGLGKLGCISAPIVPRSVSSEIGYVAEKLRARFVVCEAGSAPLLREVPAQLRTVEAMIGVGAGHGLSHDYQQVVAAASPDEPVADVKPDDLLTVKFTSGTTGVAKGCLRSHNNFVMAAAAASIELPLLDDDTALIASPLAAGMAVSQLTMMIQRGVRTVMMPRFEPAQFLALIPKERVTLGYAMDSMTRRLFALPEYETTDLSSLRLFHGVNQLDVFHRLRQHRSFKARFTSGFASSECGGLVTFKKPEEYDRVLVSPNPERDFESQGPEGVFYNVECLDDDLKPVPLGEVGELSVRGPSVFRGYWELPEETARTLRGGWLLTGDLASKDERGNIYLRGRKKDMIKSGGLSVFPAEVEPVLRAHPMVADVCVLGIPDKEWGEKVVACVIARGECSEAELIEFCRDKLAGHKRPKAVFFIKSFPMNASGKIVKRDLAKLVIDMTQTTQPA